MKKTIISKEYINYIKDKKAKQREKDFIELDNRYNTFGKVNNY